MWVPPGCPFFVVAVIVRVLEAVGASGYTTASFAICAHVYPGRVSSVIIGQIRLHAFLFVSITSCNEKLSNLIARLLAFWRHSPALALPLDRPLVACCTRCAVVIGCQKVELTLVAFAVWRL